MGKLDPMPTEADAPIYCPHCSSCLLDKVVPEEHREHSYGNYYKREIGIEIPERYDGVWHFMCPDCSGTFGGVEAMFKKRLKHG
jgi:DNA-directed RNA polymerase subunit RPC12/RpoP